MLLKLEDFLLKHCIRMNKQLFIKKKKTLGVSYIFKYLTFYDQFKGELCEINCFRYCLDFCKKNDLQ